MVVEFSYIDFPIPLKIVNVQIKSKGITPLDCKYPKESEQRNARYYSSPYEHFLNPQSVNIGKPDAAYRQSNGVFVASKIVHR